MNESSCILLRGISALLTAIALSQAAGAGEIRTYGYTAEWLVAETPLHGANGMEFDADNQLVVGSMMSGTVFRLDTDTGAVETLVGAPRGIADDLAIAPDGTIAWTTTPAGIVHKLAPGGTVERVARNLPMINSIYFNKKGRLFAAQVTQELGSLYELDVSGAEEPVVVVADLPGLNGFEIDANNNLYGPLQWAGKIIRIDLDTGSLTEIADGFTRPVAVNLDSQGRIIALDYLTGEVFRVNPGTGARELIARTQPPIDNLAIRDDDRIFVSHPCFNGIEEIDPETGAIRQVAQGSLGLPGGAVLDVFAGRPALLVAGLFCHNVIDLETGAVTLLPRQGETVWSGSIDRREGLVVASGFSFGQVQWLDEGSGEPLHTIEGLDAPYDIRLQADDSVLVAEYGSGRILQLYPDKNRPQRVIVDGLAGPVGLLMRDNELIVSEADAGLVSAIDAKSGEKRIIASGLEQPEGIAELPDGAIVIAEVAARRLTLVDPDTGTQTIIADELPVGLPPFMGGAKTFLPTGVVADRNGVIYVVSDERHNVIRLTPE